jgi:hypothetical protein
LRGALATKQIQLSLHGVEAGLLRERNDDLRVFLLGCLKNASETCRAGKSNPPDRAKARADGVPTNSSFISTKWWARRDHAPLPALILYPG